MTGIKLMLLWVSAGILFVTLGLSFAVGADRDATAAGPVISPASDSLVQPSVQPPAQPASSVMGDKQCGEAEGALATLTLPSEASSTPTVNAACPAGTARYCCTCAGFCGCKPRTMNPQTFCGC